MDETPASLEAKDQLIPMVPASPFEEIPAGEEAATKAIEKALAERVKADAQNGPARRDAHPKAHGCVRATFEVLADLPANLQQGIFSQPRRYEAIIRFSNGGEKPQADSVGDARGMAIKLLGVEDSRSKTQDFLLINSPILFVRNAIDYVSFITATNPLRFFFPGWNPFAFRWHELFAARSMTSATVSNMLDLRYWSVTPYLFGPACACKFSARPIGPASPFQDRTGPDFLRDNLVKSLAAGAAEFEFCVQLRGDAGTMPIEDPTIKWREADAPFAPVARITIPQQSFDAPEQRAFCENLSFTPWHGLDEHRPLGGLNRVRRTVYETISRLRHDINHTVREEPAP